MWPWTVLLCSSRFCVNIYKINCIGPVTSHYFLSSHHHFFTIHYYLVYSLYMRLSKLLYIILIKNLENKIITITDQLFLVFESDWLREPCKSPSVSPRELLHRLWCKKLMKHTHIWQFILEQFTTLRNGLIKLPTITS